jgi:hypothetical protein
MKLKGWKIILLSFIAVIITILLLAPGIIRRMAVKNGDKWLGRKIELERLRINYFTSTIRLHDFKAYEANKKDVFAQFDTLVVDASFWKLLKREIVVEHILLSGLKTNIIQKDSVFNFTDLVEFYSKPDGARQDKAPPEEKKSSSPFTFQLSNIHIANGDLHFIDAGENEQISLVSIDLVIPYLGWKKKVDRASGLKFNFENGGYLGLNVDWDPVTRDLAGTVTIDQLDLSNFSGYLHKFINHDMISGQLNAVINVHRPVRDLHSLQLSGDVRINRLSVTAKDGDTLAGIDQLWVHMADVKPLMNTYVIDTLLIQNPAVRYEVYDSTRTNFSDLAKKEPGKDREVEPDTLGNTEKKEGKAFTYAVHSFLIRGGTFDFIDHSPDSIFTYNLSEIDATADSVVSQNNRAFVSAQMKLNDRGKLVSELSFDPKDPVELDLTYVITDFQLSDVNIYSTYYAGLPILYGNTYYKSEVEVHNGILDSKNDIIIEGIELGDQSKGVTDLPIGLALVLLKDKNGDVSMKIPVKGDLNEPGVGLGKIIMGSFSDFIIKVAATPFKILSRTVNVKPNDIKSIKYDRLDAGLSRKKIRQLEALLKLESKKPDIGIELVYFNDPTLEAEAIAMDMVGQKFNNRKRDYRKDREEFAEYARKKVGNDTIAVEKACLQLVDKENVDTFAEELKNERISAVQEFLDSKSDSTQIRLYIPDTDAPKNTGSEPVFEVKYSLKAKKKALEEEMIYKNDSTAMDSEK